MPTNYPAKYYVGLDVSVTVKPKPLSLKMDEGVIVKINRYYDV